MGLVSVLFLAASSCWAVDEDALQKWDEFVSAKCSAAGSTEVKLRSADTAWVEMFRCPKMQRCAQTAKEELVLLEAAGYVPVAVDAEAENECMFMIEEQQTLGSLSEFIVVRYAAANGSMFRLQTRKQAAVANNKIPFIQSLYRQIQQINLREKFPQKKK